MDTLDLSRIHVGGVVRPVDDLDGEHDVGSVASPLRVVDRVAEDPELVLDGWRRIGSGPVSDTSQRFEQLEAAVLAGQQRAAIARS